MRPTENFGLTARWAHAAGADRARLYQALADRGGFCDCEVLYNAANTDDEENGLVLVAGRIDGDVAEGLELLDGWRTDDVPPAATKIAHAAEPDTYIDIYVDERGRMPLQTVDCGTLGGILRDLSTKSRARSDLQLLVGFVDEPIVLVIAHRGSPLRLRTLGDGPLPMEVTQLWPNVSELVARIRAGVS